MNDETLIDDLCGKFGELFANIKQLRGRRNQAENENEKLQQLIQDEVESYESSIHELQQYQQLSQQQARPSDSDELLLILQDLEQQILVKQQAYRGLLNRRGQQQELGKQQAQLRSTLFHHLETIQGEIQQMRESTEQNKVISAQLQVGIEETTTKIDEMLEKIEGLETGLQEKEKEVAEQIEANFAQNENFRVQQNELRQIMRANCSMDKKVRELEKQINRTYTELEKRVQRLQVLETNKQQMQTKVKKAIDGEQQLLSLKEQNTKLAQENLAIREKLTQFIKALPPELKRSQSGKKGRRDDKKAGGGVPSKAGEILGMFDETICRNQLSIKGLSGEKAGAEQELSELDVEIEQLGQKYEQMKRNINMLKQQYETLAKQTKTGDKKADKGAYGQTFGTQEKNRAEWEGEEEIPMEEGQFEEYMNKKYPYYTGFVEKEKQKKK